jgi:hypothetical protein
VNPVEGVNSTEADPMEANSMEGLDTKNMKDVRV